MMTTLDQYEDGEGAGTVSCDCGHVIRLLEHAYVVWCRVCGQEWDVDWQNSRTTRSDTAEMEPVWDTPGPLVVDEG